jgi:cytochrome b pre-mRNA-processing protein 3
VITRLFRRPPELEPARRLYDAAVAQGRQPVFYARLGVPDSVDGRFDLIALHVWLLQRRLRRAGQPAEGVAQQLAEVFFADMDLSLREMGAADIGVGRRVKRMIEGFAGRALAYDAALAGGDQALAVALGRNLYGGRPAAPGQVLAVAGYLRAAEAALNGQDDAAALAGSLAFPPPPAGGPS